MLPLLIGALLAGLAGSPHCVAMCGGFASSCATSAPGAGAWHVGRLATYAVLGAVAGAFGAALPGPGWVLTVVAAGLTLWFALALAGAVPSFAPRLPGVSRLATAAVERGGLLGRASLGAASALLPCGLLYTALSVPVASASPVTGALAMVGFGLGTVPLIAAATLGLRRVVATRPWARRALAVAVLAAGWWSVGVRHLAAAEGQEEVACH